jgi:hypothetical protein
MSGALIDRMSAAALSHMLAGHGQDAGDLANVLTEAAGRKNLHTAGHNRVVTDPGCRRSDWRIISPRTISGDPYRLPRMTMTMRPDPEGDLVVSVREMEISPDILIYREGARDPVCLLVRRGIPEIMSVAVGGRRLDRIVSHPALDTLPLVVASVTTLAPHRLDGLVLVDWDSCAVLVLEPFGKTVLRPKGR